MLNLIEVKQHRQVVSVVTDVDSHRMATTLAERWKIARERAGLGYNELDRLIGQTSGYSSPLERGTKPTPSVKVMADAAKVLNVSLDWLATGEGPMDRTAPDPPISQFLMELRRLPGLEAWLSKNAGSFTVSQVAKVIAIYEVSPPSSHERGEPHGGWGSYFDDALSGRLTKKRKADVEGVVAAELAQMSPAARKRLRSAPKK